MARTILIPAVLLVLGAAAAIALVVRDRERESRETTVPEDRQASAVDSSPPERTEAESGSPERVTPQDVAEPLPAPQARDPEVGAKLQRETASLFAAAIDGTGPNPQAMVALFEELLQNADVESSGTSADGKLTIKLSSPVPGMQLEAWILPGKSGAADDFQVTLLANCENGEEIRPFLGTGIADMSLFVESTGGAVTKASVFAQTVPTPTVEAQQYFEPFGEEGFRTGSMLQGTGAETTHKSLMVSTGVDPKGERFWRQRWVAEPPRHAFVPAQYQSILTSMTALRQRVATSPAGK
jgi:hypothetical protein